MRIECENCGAKYSISDDKIIGRVFRVRCKKCSNTITVDGTELAGDETEEATRIFDPSAQGGDAIWYVVIDGSQTGPLTEDEVREQVRLGAVDGETFGWRDGMDDWIPVSEIAELAGLVASRAPTPAAAVGGAGFDEEATRVVAGDDYDFSVTGEEPPAAPAPAPFSGAVQRPASTDYFGGGASAASAPVAASFGATLAATAAGASAPVDKSIGQRNESSVLFSLSDLTSSKKSTQATSTADLPRTEGSGLIDIRVLAGAAPAAAAGGGAAPGGAGVGGTASMAAVPIAPLVPVPTRRSNSGLVVALAIAAVVIVGLLAAIVVVLLRPPAPPVVVATPTPAAEAPAAAPSPEPTPEPAPAVAEAPAAAVEGSAAAVEGSAAAVAAAEAAAPADDGTSAPPAAADDRAERPAVAARTEEPAQERAAEPERPTTTARAPSRTDEPEPARPASRERSGGDEAVASALSAIRSRGGDSPTPERSEPERPQTAAAEPAPAPAPTGLSRSDVAATVRRYASRIASCRGSAADGSSYTVAFVIQPSGSVTNVNPSESDDTATCLAGVVRDMSFPRFEGDPVPVRYPFRF
jgi:predicted Zn finger-like uncharacterized protein